MEQMRWPGIRKDMRLTEGPSVVRIECTLQQWVFCLCIYILDPIMLSKNRIVQDNFKIMQFKTFYISCEETNSESPSNLFCVTPFWVLKFFVNSQKTLDWDFILECWMDNGHFSVRKMLSGVGGKPEDSNVLKAKWRTEPISWAKCCHLCYEWVLRLESIIRFSNVTIMEDLDKGNFRVVGAGWGVVWRG